MKLWTDFYIFETIPKDQRAQGKVGWWSSVQQGKQVPFAFARAIRLTADVVLVGLAVLIGVTTKAPAMTLVGMEILFVSIGALLLVSRIFKQFFLVVGMYLAIIVLGCILNLFYPGTWGSVGLYIVCVIMLYRFPSGWSLPLAGICILTLLATDGALHLLPFQHPGNARILVFSLVLAGGLCWFGWAQRAQYMLVVRLHETEEQLRKQIARSKALAAEQERTRIARDIHDVLSHSLAVLSIQIQAARHLMSDPARLTAKLDDMATLIRESITESRRVVGMLRELPPAPVMQDDLSTNLRSIATTFNERTGVSCRFVENGTPHNFSPQQRETLQLALREMLTNAHRHGTAHTVWITLGWQDAGLTLAVRDDGLGGNAAHTETFADEMGNSAGGHHGLEGMRERAQALGGQVEAGPAKTGGFAVSLSLPYEQSGEPFAQKGRQS
jgi:signal transduction histidine kinase